MRRKRARTCSLESRDSLTTTTTTDVTKELPSGQEEKAAGLNQQYSRKQALHSLGNLVLTKDNTVPVKITVVL